MILTFINLPSGTVPKSNPACMLTWFRRRKKVHCLYNTTLLLKALTFRSGSRSVIFLKPNERHQKGQLCCHSEMSYINERWIFLRDVFFTIPSLGRYIDVLQNWGAPDTANNWSYQVRWIPHSSSSFGSTLAHFWKDSLKRANAMSSLQLQEEADRAMVVRCRCKDWLISSWIKAMQCRCNEIQMQRLTHIKSKQCNAMQCNADA